MPSPIRLRARLSLAQVPVPVLDSYLRLAPDQEKKIQAITTKYRADIKGLGLSQGGVQVDVRAMQDMFRKRGELGDKATTAIEAILMRDQRAMVPDMRRELGSLRAAGIPLEALPALKLTADQKKKLAAAAADNQNQIRAAFQSGNMETMRAGQQTARQKTMGVLTAQQKKIVEKYLQQTRGVRNQTGRSNPF
jgi:hypothetical protein